jgi:hypothetical protein
MNQPQGTQGKSVTFVQIYTASLSTLSVLFLGLIMNFLWELKEWKGKKDEKDERQDVSITSTTVQLSNHLADHEQLKAKMDNLYFVKPEDQPTIKNHSSSRK